MKVNFKVNNYTLGAKVKSTPTHKIILSERIDSKYTKITYNEITDRELQFIQKVLANKGTVVSN